MRWWWVGDDAAAASVCQALGAMAEWPAPTCFGSAEEAIAARVAQAPDLVVIQLELPCTSGIQLAQVLRRRTPRPRVLLLSERGQAVFAIRARKAGARGFMRLSAGPQALAEAVRAVAMGKVAIDRETVAAITASSSDAVTQQLTRLTPREFEVLLMVWRGFSREHIAGCLGLRQATVKAHIEALVRRTGCDGPEGLAALQPTSGP
jgi:DNA-binding NarL/FixJ family response regulator